MLLANNLLRWSCLPGFGRDGRLRELHGWVVSHLGPKAKDSCIPFGEANDGLIKDFDEGSPSVAYTCKTSVEIVQGLDSSFNPVARPLAQMRLGYRARTVSLGNRSTSVDDVNRYLIWHYQKDTSVFRIPSRFDWDSKVRIPLRLRAELSGTWDPVDYVAYKESGLKTAYKCRTRVVTSWPLIGPWVFPLV